MPKKKKVKKSSQPKKRKNKIAGSGLGRVYANKKNGKKRAT